MGTQLQWVDGISDSKIIYNVRTQDKTAVYPGFGSRIRDIHTGDTRELPLPVYVVAPNGSYALSVDYRRLYITHETIGYSEHGGPFRSEERRVGKGWVRTGKSRWLPYHRKQKKIPR